MIKTLFHVQLGYQVEAKGVTPALIDQVHGTEIRNFEKEPVCEADGIFAENTNQELFVFTADCLPVFLFTEKEKGPIAALHSGWRGTRDGIVEKALNLFNKSEVHIAIGPGIGPCCFEVKEDFLESFRKLGKNPMPHLKSGKFDLIDYLRNNDLADIPADKIHLDLFRCTYCSSPKLPSYRRDRSTDPRIKSWIKWS